MKQDCNRCDPIGSRRGRIDPENCRRFSPPKGGWQLAELALAYPTTLNAALSALPFEANLTFYLQ